jgi:uracil-DNA glycosylase family 4
MLIGEAPGKDEDKHGRPFIGKTGQELNDHYLPLAGLRRDNVYVTNAIKCLPNRSGGKIDLNRSKDLELLYVCADCSLYEEIRSVRPSLIVPLGAFACHSIDPSIELDVDHGRPIETSWGTAFPMFHPSAGIHEPKRMLQIRSDYYRLGRYLKGKLTIPKDEYPNPKYWEMTRPGILPSPEGAALACDTEVTRHMEPYCLTYSTAPGTGCLIKADNHWALNMFQDMLERWTGPILLHNWLFDQKVVAAMGLRFPRHLIVDTMSRAFHLGNLPQGLKALAYRELGMKMEDFDDLVTPYSVPLCLDYLRKASEREWPKPEENLVRD